MPRPSACLAPEDEPDCRADRQTSNSLRVDRRNYGLAPAFLFVLLFGLSMDYHVFILSRVREGVDQGMSTDEAVAHGIKSTAGTVTSAAVVMVFVFAIFATPSALDFKMMGVGLAVAVLIDATLIRAVEKRARGCVSSLTGELGSRRSAATTPSAPEGPC